MTPPLSPMPGANSRRSKRPSITAGLALAVLAALVLSVEMWRFRNPALSCIEAEITLDADALEIDTMVPGGRTGEWVWWPTGLECTYPRIGGGWVEVSPGPLLSLVFLAGIAGVGIAVGGAMASRRRNS